MVRERNRAIVIVKSLYALELFDEMPKRGLSMSSKPKFLQYCMLASHKCIRGDEPSICINCALRSDLRKSRKLCE